MGRRLHYLLTALSLLFLGLIAFKPEVLRQYSEERQCRLLKGRMDCANTAEYKVRHVARDFNERI